MIKKLERHGFGVIWSTNTGAGFLRLSRGFDPRWKHRWVVLPFFGWKVSKRVRRRKLDETATRTRIQRLTLAWVPFILFYHATNKMDIIEIEQKE